MPNLTETMRNVRQAYRFLGDFNNRLQGVLQVLQDEFPSHSHCWWTPFPRDGFLSRKRTTAFLKGSSLDSLPFRNFLILYSPVSEPKARSNSWLLEVEVDLDVGFHVGSEDRDGWPDPNNHSPVCASESRIHLAAWRCDKVEGSPSWKDAWDSQKPLDPECQHKKQRRAENGFEFSVVVDYEPLEKLGNREKVQQFAQRAKDHFRKELNLKIQDPAPGT